MLKNITILIFTLLAVTFAPLNSYACKKHTQKHKLVNCCLTKSEGKCNHKADAADNGKTGCNHKGCSCAAAQTVNLLFPIEVTSIKAPELNLKNTFFSYNHQILSKGYYSIWLPPNIS